MADVAVDIIGFQGTQHPTKEISLGFRVLPASVGQHDFIWHSTFLAYYPWIGQFCGGNGVEPKL
jgi:hypothetical protein